MPWPAQLLHFVDFEGSLASGILEYGLVSLRDGEVVGTLGRICAARGPIRPEDSAVHRLDAAATATAAPFADDFALFAERRTSGPFAAHFASAENTLLKATWPYPRAVPDFSRADFATAPLRPDWGPWIDTGRLLPQALGNTAPAGLSALIAGLGLQAALDAWAAQHCPPARRHYHAALYDALAGALLLRWLAQQPAWSGGSLRWLFEHSTLDPERRERLRQPELF